jgi:uncharacterized protein YndB with AHSA1/START domain
MNPESKKVAPVVVEKTLNHPIEKVWQAITDKDQMKQWYFDLPDFRLEVGFAFEFTAGDENKQWLHACVITEVIPMTKIAYTWRYPEYDGDSLVTWELTDLGGKTKLMLTHSGLENFPSDVAALKRENFDAGWTSFIREELVKYLDKV